VLLDGFFDAGVAQKAPVAVDVVVFNDLTAASR
jgi:hypothetical protein